MARTRWSWTIAVAAALVSLTLVCTSWSSAAPAGVPARAGPDVRLFIPAVAVPPAPDAPTLGGSSRLGVWIGGGDDRTVNLLKGTGARTTRASVMWSILEPAYAAPPAYNFGAYDGLFAPLAAAGIVPIVTIGGNPSWAASTVCGPISRLDRFGAFVSAMVAHYKAPPYRVKYWEIFNEPDNRSVKWGEFLGGCFGNDPAAYVAVLRTAYTAIRQADPEAKVVLGGLAMGHYTDPQEGDIFNANFLAQVLALNGAAYFDLANVHYYSSQAHEWTDYGADIAGKTAALRGIMSAYGVAKPVVVTELSWTSTPQNDPRLPEMQARYVPKVLARGIFVDLYAMTWFSLKDWPGADYPYGLADTAERPKPAYRAFQQAVAEFGDATSVRAMSPAEVGVATGVEGYAFRVSGEERWVLWGSAEGVSLPVRLPGRAREAGDKLGQPVPLSGGGLPTTILLDDSPVYVRLNP